MQANRQKVETYSKSRWGVGVAFLYTVFAVFILALVFVSISNPPDLVRKDYYEAELLYQQQINRVKRTSALPASVDLRYSAARDAIIVEFPIEIQGEISGTVTLFRPSDSRMDRTLPIELDERREQWIDTSEKSLGMWRVIVLWSNQGQDYYAEKIVVLR